MRRSLVIRLVVVLGLMGGIGVGLATLPVKLYLTNFLEWVQGIGPWGPVLLGLFYVPASLLFLPGSIITLGAGFAFGVIRATIAVSLGSVLGASAAFLAGRTLLRGLIEQKVVQNPRFHAIDQAVAEHGFKIVLLARLSPVFPFNLLNYAFGLTKVSFRDYVLASWVGMLPGTILYAYIGSAAKNLADLAAGRIEGGVGQKVLFFVGLVATIVVTAFVTRLAKQAFNRTIEQSNAREPHRVEVAPDVSCTPHQSH